MALKVASTMNRKQVETKLSSAVGYATTGMEAETVSL
eukprot:CAMPEP_0174738782 /NCGR_PEP_ID=MMETSP1094-20130205/70519_1 /TAXON_ID=156173 /ORGANISM="Chrysochromulina brevifilum, Strain UTEX LB 985" /LENGTH=36 /DNA_ID= /DNA_START= /DNA_END= /DNA_ORIENTATION=